MSRKKKLPSIDLSSLIREHPTINYLDAHIYNSYIDQFPTFLSSFAQRDVWARDSASTFSPLFFWLIRSNLLPNLAPFRLLLTCVIVPSIRFDGCMLTLTTRPPTTLSYPRYLPHEIQEYVSIRQSLESVSSFPSSTARSRVLHDHGRCMKRTPIQRKWE